MMKGNQLSLSIISLNPGIVSLHNYMLFFKSKLVAQKQAMYRLQTRQANQLFTKVTKALYLKSRPLNM